MPGGEPRISIYMQRLLGAFDDALACQGPWEYVEARRNPQRLVGTLEATSGLQGSAGGCN